MFPGLGGALVLLFVALLAQVGASFAWAQLWKGSLDLTLLAGLSNLTALSAVAAFGFWYSKEPPRWKFPADLTAPSWFWTGLVLSAAGGTVVLGELANLTTWMVPLPSELAALFNRLTEGNPLISLFTLAVVAPLTEETLFRGLLLRGFSRRYGVWPALLLSSALFALFHLNLWQALAAFLAGLYLGWVFLSTRSLLAPILVHALFNGLPVILTASGLQVTGYNTPTTPGVADFQPLWWLCLGSGILALGLVLTKRWSPLSPRLVSDTVAS